MRRGMAAGEGVGVGGGAGCAWAVLKYRTGRLVGRHRVRSECSIRLDGSLSGKHRPADTSRATHETGSARMPRSTNSRPGASVQDSGAGWRRGASELLIAVAQWTLQHRGAFFLDGRVWRVRCDRRAEWRRSPP